MKRRKQVRRLSEEEVQEIRKRFFLLPTAEDAELLEEHGVKVSDFDWRQAREFAKLHPGFEVKWK